MKSLVSSQVIDDLKESKENCISNFTPERISSLKKQIRTAYEPGVGIGASVLSRILFGYQQAIYKYEGIAFHFFDLIATRSPESRSRKGSLFFVYKDEAGTTEFPVCESEWHNYSEISSQKEKLESAWNSSSSSSSSSENSKYLTDFSEILSNLSEVVSVMSDVVKSLSDKVSSNS